uniref:(northern house mosquito) hypothetical protein n=1 Tax=Culex pipiens TaxID=7175 RepID=A0A8D8AJJ0_CULPI
MSGQGDCTQQTQIPRMSLLSKGAQFRQILSNPSGIALRRGQLPVQSLWRTVQDENGLHGAHGHAQSEQVQVRNLRKILPASSVPAKSHANSLRGTSVQVFGLQSRNDPEK